MLLPEDDELAVALEEDVLEAVDDKLSLADTEFDEHGEGDGEPEEDTELDDERVHG